MILKIFTQPSCPQCPAAKTLARQLKAKSRTPVVVEEFDTSTATGLAEASFYSVMGTPSLILTNNQSQEIAAWRGKVPSLANLLSKIK